MLGGYVSIEQDGLRPVAVEYEGTLQNGGYAVQWWVFAALTLVGYVCLARRQVRENRRNRPNRERGRTGEIGTRRLTRERAATDRHPLHGGPRGTSAAT